MPAAVTAFHLGVAEEERLVARRRLMLPDDLPRPRYEFGGEAHHLEITHNECFVENGRSPELELGREREGVALELEHREVDPAPRKQCRILILNSFVVIGSWND